MGSRSVDHNSMTAQVSTENDSCLSPWKLPKLPTSPYSEPILPESSKPFSACSASALCLRVLALSGWPSGRLAARQPQNLRDFLLACVPERVQDPAVLGWTQTPRCRYCAASGPVYCVRLYVAPEPARPKGMGTSSCF